jgi:hypothetical protein
VCVELELVKFCLQYDEVQTAPTHTHTAHGAYKTNANHKK